MKQSIFIFLLLLIPFFPERTRYKQRYSLSGNGRYGYPYEHSIHSPVRFAGRSVVCLRQLPDGRTGTGFSLYDKEVLIPLFADVRFNIVKPARFTPFLNCGVGYSFAPSKEVNGGFYLFPAIGVETSLFSKYTVLLSLGYELQELDRLKEYTTPSFVSSYQESLSLHSLSLKVGIVF